MNTDDLTTTLGPGPDGGAERSTRIGLQVYETLLSRLMSQGLPSGARVTIDALARELNVSQTPIREALSKLEADGLVVRTHMAGYRVAPRLTRDQFDDLVEIRLLLEPAAARHAAERMTPQQVAELRELAELMSVPPGEDDPRLAYAIFARQDAQFHDVVAAGGNNSLIRDALARLHAHVHLFRLVYQNRITSEAVEEHSRIVSTIVSRDPDAAAYAMRVHIERSRDRFLDSFTA